MAGRESRQASFNGHESIAIVVGAIARITAKANAPVAAESRRETANPTAHAEPSPRAREKPRNARIAIANRPPRQRA